MIFILGFVLSIMGFKKNHPVLGSRMALLFLNRNKTIRQRAKDCQPCDINYTEKCVTLLTILLLYVFTFLWLL